MTHPQTHRPGQADARARRRKQGPARDRDAAVAIVLAAGRSSRMGGRNKLLLPFAGGTVVASVVRALAAAGFPRILAVVGHEGARVAHALEGLPVRIWRSPAYRRGLSASLKAGVRAADPAARWLLLALGDMPEVRAGTFRKLRLAARTQGARAILVPTSGGRRGNPVLFSAHYRPELLRLTGDRGARKLLQRYAHAVVEVHVKDPGIFRDLDRPEDLPRRTGPGRRR